MFKLGKKMTGLALGGMLLAGSIAGSAFADTNAQGTPDQSRDEYYKEFISEFAANLGVGEDQVTAALEATKEQMVQEQLEQGKITQEQADKILAQEGFGFGLGMGRPAGPGGEGKGDMTQNTNFLNEAAAALGMTTDELKAEMESGKTLDEIATEKGITMDQLRQKMPKPQAPTMKDKAEAGNALN
ncbi:hypothetical protein [Desulforamulus ruminis]|uniref:Fis family transcriptional regulator n=1 Tax=Desulforamulus ruminis (strain ATCC 23193 / DSM 2154 / NCIMB 8452 / DL) TaxID=696281 RepID=F6DTN1_DESRL|nr:hypothetical protein [Desulforamulus ruminis]AEG61205.1 Fis family transcriptional regulator [Desulforamulus ruminis DSM 2154]